MRFPEARLLVFARAPVAGQCKTRLIPALGAEGAAGLAGRLLGRTLATALAADLAPIELCCAPDCEHPALQAWAGRVRLRRQVDGDLGRRMAAALDAALAEAPMAVLIGSDCPTLAGADLAAAFAALAAGTGVVVGPAEDGGYWLIGTRRPRPALFDAIPWGGPEVLEATRNRLRSSGQRWLELPVRRDLDRPQDLDLPEVRALLERD